MQSLLEKPMAVHGAGGAGLFASRKRPVLMTLGIGIAAMMGLSQWYTIDRDAMPYSEDLANAEMPKASIITMEIDLNANDTMGSVGGAPISLTATEPWTAVTGTLTMVSIGSDNSVWGVNSAYKIFRHDDYKTTWTTIGGSLKHVDVAGSPANIWGVNSADNIYFRSGSGAWEQIAGSLKQVSVAPNGHVWGVNSNNAIYFRDGYSGTWKSVAGALKYVSVGGAQGQYVWGVNSADNIYFRAGYSGSWQLISGGLKQIEVNDLGVVWGVNSADNIYKRAGVAGSWVLVSGALKHVSAGPQVWGVNSAGAIYKSYR